MEDKYIKAKKCLDKEFHMMQMQADAAKARGGILMEKEDIQYLRSLKIDRLKNITLNLMNDNYSSKKVLGFITEAQKNQFETVTLLGEDLTNTDDKILRKKGYFTVLGYIGVKVTYIFFNEENYIKNSILRFQDLFGTITDFHKSGLI